MSTTFRTVFAVLMIVGALVVAAASPGSASGGPESGSQYVGTWITWRQTPQGAMSPCTRLYVAAESESTLDGMWAAPGWNGLVRGTVRQEGDDVVWRGEWRTGGTVGAFRFALEGAAGVASRFHGTYTPAGDGQPRYWNGARDVEGRTPRVPCSWPD